MFNETTAKKRLILLQLASFVAWTVAIILLAFTAYDYLTNESLQLSRFILLAALSIALLNIATRLSTNVRFLKNRIRLLTTATALPDVPPVAPILREQVSNALENSKSGPGKAMAAISEALESNINN